MENETNHMADKIFSVGNRGFTAITNLCSCTGKPTFWFFQLTAFKWPAQTDLSPLEHQWFTDMQPGPDLTDTPTLRGFTTPCWQRLEWECVKSVKKLNGMPTKSVENCLCPSGDRWKSSKSSLEQLTILSILWNRESC